MNVVEIMRSAARDLAVHRPEADDSAHEEMLCASHAVAELIAAGEELQASMDENEESRSRFDVTSAKRFIAADARHRAALAACGDAT